MFFKAYMAIQDLRVLTYYHLLPCIIMAQIIWSTRRLVKVLLGIQQKFYQTSSRAIFLLLDVQQIFTPSKRCLVGSYFSATRRLVENFYQTSSTKSSTRRLLEQKIWANINMNYIAKVMGAPMNVISDSRVLPLHLIRESLMHYLTIVMSTIHPQKRG